MVIHKTLHQQDLNEPVKVCTTSKTFSIQNQWHLHSALSWNDKLQPPMQALVITPVLCQPLDKAVYCNLQVSMTLTMEPSDKAVYCKLWDSINLKKKINLLVLCQPLDKAVYCKLQVSMTWALEHSDKAVTANSELAFSVGKTKTLMVNQPEDGCSHYTHHSNAWRNHQHRLNQT